MKFLNFTKIFYQKGGGATGGVPGGRGLQVRAVRHGGEQEGGLSGARRHSQGLHALGVHHLWREVCTQS